MYRLLIAFTFCSLFLWAGSSVAQPLLNCTVRANAAHFDGTDNVLEEAAIDCAGFRGQAETARIDSDGTVSTSSVELSFDSGWVVSGTSGTISADGGVALQTACLQFATRVESPLVCASELTFDGSRWTGGSATVEVSSSNGLDRTSYLVATVSCDMNACQLEGTQVQLGVSPPYPVGVIDTAGRSAGWLPPALSYRTDRGFLTDTGWLLPLGESSIAELRLVGGSAPFIGLRGEAEWPVVGQPTSHVEVLAAYDPSARDEVRLRLSSRAGLAARDNTLGVALLGEVITDGRLAPDFGELTLQRLRSDRPIAAAVWTGSETSRFWGATYGRRTARAAGTASMIDVLSARDSVSPRMVYRGSGPSFGYLHGLSWPGIAQVSNRFRFDRWMVLDSGAQRAQSELSLTTGGQFTGLQFPGFVLTPGLWLDLNGEFGDPAELETFRRFSSRIIATGDFSSSWVGGTGARHFVDLRSTVRLAAFRYSDTTGSPLRPDYEVTQFAPVAVRTGVEQWLRTDELTMHLPLWWIASGEWDQLGNYFVTGLDLDWTLGSVLLQPSAEFALDMDSGDLMHGEGRVDLGFGHDSESGTFGTIGGRMAAIRSGYAISQRQVSPLPSLARGLQSEFPEDLELIGVVASLQVGQFGWSASSYWGLGLDQRPDVVSSVWLGSMRGTRLALEGRYLADGTGTVALSLDLH